MYKNKNKQELETKISFFAIEPNSGEVKAYLRKSALSLPFPRWYVAINGYGESYKRGFYRYSSAIRHLVNLIKKYNLEIIEKVKLKALVQQAIPSNRDINRKCLGRSTHRF